MNNETTTRQQEYWDQRAKGAVRGLKNRVLARFFRTGFVGINRIREYYLVSRRLLGDTVLDVGCGDGAFLARLQRLSKQKHWSGIDFSPPMVEIARARGLDCRVMNMCRLEFRDQAFDTVYAVRAVKNVVERAGQELALKEISRVARRRVIIFDSFMWPGSPKKMPFYNLDLDLRQVKRVMQESGYRLVEESFFPSKFLFLKTVAEQVSSEGCLVFDRAG